MSKVLPSDNLKLVLSENGYKYYLFKPTFTRVFPKSGNMRKMNFLQVMRFHLMRMHGGKVYILARDDDEVLASIAFSSGGQYRFPFADKNDLIYGPSYTVPEHRGNGYAVMIAERVLTVFEKDYKTVYATVREDNLASLKCLEKSGFVNPRKISSNKITKMFKLDDKGDHFLVEYKNKCGE